MYIIVYLIIFSLCLFISHLIASAFYNIAVSKGHTEKKYYWISFLIGIIGYLLVCALPDLKARSPKIVEKAPIIESEKKSEPVEVETKKEKSNLLDIFKNDIK